MNTITSGINLSDPAPHKEPERQYYFIEKAKEYVRKEAEEAGRPMTFCVTTFGCQMNARDSEKLRGILLEIGYEDAGTGSCRKASYKLSLRRSYFRHT